MAFPWKWSITWATEEGYRGALSVPKSQSLALGLQQCPKTDDDQEKGPPVAKDETEYLGGVARKPMCDVKMVTEKAGALGYDGLYP